MGPQKLVPAAGASGTAVAVLEHGLGQLFQLTRVDPALAVGQLFRTGHLQAPTLFQGGDELAGFQQAVVRARVQPGVAAPMISTFSWPISR